MELLSRKNQKRINKKEKIMTNIEKSLQNRRTIYSLDKNIKSNEEEITKTIKNIIRSCFNPPKIIKPAGEAQKIQVGLT